MTTIAEAEKLMSTAFRLDETQQCYLYDTTKTALLKEACAIIGQEWDDQMIGRFKDPERVKDIKWWQEENATKHGIPVPLSVEQQRAVHNATSDRMDAAAAQKHREQTAGGASGRAMVEGENAAVHQMSQAHDVQTVQEYAAVRAGYAARGRGSRENG